MKIQLEKIIPQQGIDIIYATLEKYSGNSQPIDSFIAQVLRESDAYSSEAEINQTVVKISATIEAISQAYQDIQSYKAKGLPVNIWLRDNLNKAIQHLPQAEQDAVIEAAKSAMKSGNVEIFKQLTNAQGDINLVADLVSNQFSDLNKTACANNLKEEIKLNVLLNAIALENVSNDESQFSKAAQSYFSAPLDNQTDNDFKKVVAAAVEIAKKKNLLSDELANASTEQITTTVDTGITSAKVAYKVAQNELHPADALDYLIDKAAARVMTTVDTVCRQGGAALGARVGAAIGGLINPMFAAMGATLGGKIGAMAGEKVADFVNTGVSKIASAAKSVAKSVYQGVSSAYNTVRGWLPW